MRKACSPASSSDAAVLRSATPDVGDHRLHRSIAGQAQETDYADRESADPSL